MRRENYTRSFIEGWNGRLTYKEPGSASNLKGWWAGWWAAYAAQYFGEAVEELH